MRFKRIFFRVWLSIAVSAALVFGGVGDLRAQAKRELAGKDEAKEDRQKPADFEWSQRPTEVEMDKRADRKRDQAIEKLKKLLPTVGDGPQKGELIFRLAEMYWTKSKYLHLKAMETWDQQLEKWYEAGAKGEQPKLEDVPTADESDLYRRQALSLYRRILDEYPRYPRKDEVLYNLASSLYDMGKKRAGVKKYWTLIKQLPDSEYTPDAWLQLGQHFFNANKLTAAIKAYTRAVESKKPRIYSFALYKLAWCDFNLQEYASSLEKFRQVIAYAKKQSGAKNMNERDRIQLMEEALSDMVRAYSHLDAVDDAFAYYIDEVGKKDAYKYLHKLAQRYNSEGKYALEIQTYRELNRRFPYAPEAPSNQSAIMQAFAQLGKTDRVRKEARRLIDLYSPNGKWARENSKNENVLDEAFDSVEEQLAQLVTEQHRAAQETKLSETYKLARDLYKEYLDKFTDTENSYRFRFFYAEILYELKQFNKAAQQYDKVVAEDAEGKFAKPAAYTAVLSWEKVVAGVEEQVGKKITDIKRGKRKGNLEKLGDVDKLEKGKSYQEEPLSEAEQRLAAACDAFVDVAPDDKEVLKIKFKSARLYYIHNKFEEAADRFGDIIDRAPRNRLARIGAKSILNSFNVREDWVNLNDWARKFAENKSLMGGDRSFRKRVQQFIEGASFNEIHYVYEKKETQEETADRYTGFVEEFPKSKYAMVALYNAIVNYDKANLLEKAIARANALLSDYEDFEISKEEKKESKQEGGTTLPEPDDIREKVLFLNGSFHERLARFEEAAALYEQYAREFEKGPRRADALFNAGLFREGLGQHERAIANFRKYVSDYPNKDDVPQITWRIGLILDRKGDHEAVIDHFAEYARKYGGRDPARELCAEFKAVEAQLELGRKDTARQGYEGLIESYKKLPEEAKGKACPLNAVALASFKLIEPEYENYMSIDLSGGEKQMTQKLVKKLEMVKELQGQYTEVLGIGQGDYGIASLYRIGYMYQHLAEAIFNTECPSRLTDDQCMIYQAALQEKAFPLEEKAIEAYDNALAKAYELGLYNEWLAKTQEALKTYEPQRFPDVHEYELIASEETLEIPGLMEME